MSYISSKTVNLEICWYVSTSIHEWSNDSKYATIIYPKQELTGQVFISTCLCQLVCKGYWIYPSGKVHFIGQVSVAF